MKEKNQNSIGKEKKKNYTLSFRPSIVNDFSNKIGYNSRSQILENLMLDFVKGQSGAIKRQKGTSLGKKENSS